MHDSSGPELSIRFLSVFSLPCAPDIPEFKYSKHGATESQLLKCLEPAQIDGEASACAHMLHPQARDFILRATRHFRLADPLANELQKTTWKVKAPARTGPADLGEIPGAQDDGPSLGFKITHIGASLFPTRIFICYIDIEPAFELSEETALQSAKLMLDSLVRTGRSFSGGGYKGTAVVRAFAKKEQRDSVNQRLGGNSNALIGGLRGEEVQLVDIVKCLLPDDCFSDAQTRGDCSDAFLMGDRFIASTFLKTEWNGQGRAFDDQDLLDLVRLSRAEGDNYEPLRDSGNSGASNHIIRTFENVAFSMSPEGVACWIKPMKRQEFLDRQFKRGRYDAIYFHLYLLALHQRCALVDLARRLDAATPPLGQLEGFCGCTEGSRFEEIGECAERLRLLRMEVSNFYLRAFFQQPATLSNHQEFYRVLQKAFGVSDLLDEVRYATSEIEHLIGSFHERISSERSQRNISVQAEQHRSLLQEIAKLISEQEKSAKSHFALTLAVEFFAIPYYMYSFLTHGMHLPEAPSAIASGLTTLAIITTTIIYTYFGSSSK